MSIKCSSFALICNKPCAAQGQQPMVVAEAGPLFSAGILKSGVRFKAMISTTLYDCDPSFLTVFRMPMATTHSPQLDCGLNFISFTEKKIG